MAIDALCTLHQKFSLFCCSISFLFSFFLFFALAGQQQPLMQSMFRVCPGYVQNMFRVCSEYVKGIFRVYSKYVQSSFRVCSEYVQGRVA